MEFSRSRPPYRAIHPHFAHNPVGRSASMPVVPHRGPYQNLKYLYQNYRVDPYPRGFHDPQTQTTTYLPGGYTPRAQAWPPLENADGNPPHQNSHPRYPTMENYNQLFHAQHTPEESAPIKVAELTPKRPVLRPDPKIWGETNLTPVNADYVELPDVHPKVPIPRGRDVTKGGAVRNERNVATVGGAIGRGAPAQRGNYTGGEFVPTTTPQENIQTGQVQKKFFVHPNLLVPQNPVSQQKQRYNGPVSIDPVAIAAFQASKQTGGVQQNLFVPNHHSTPHNPIISQQQGYNIPRPPTIARQVTIPTPQQSPHIPRPPTIAMQVTIPTPPQLPQPHVHPVLEMLPLPNNIRSIENFLAVVNSETDMTPTEREMAVLAIVEALKVWDRNEEGDARSTGEATVREQITSEMEVWRGFLGEDGEAVAEGDQYEDEGEDNEEDVESLYDDAWYEMAEYYEGKYVCL